MTRIGVTGAAGRMGKTLIEAIAATDGLILAAALEHSGSTLLGCDAGELAGVGKSGVALNHRLEDVVADIDVLIDFTVPVATLANVAICQRSGVPMVIGTTGFAAGQQEQLEAAAGAIAICQASNFSTGVNLCFKLV